MSSFNMNHITDILLLYINSCSNHDYETSSVSAFIYSDRFRPN